MNPLCEFTENGLYCSQGGFYIDPVRPVQRAVITHAHADHARQGSTKYLAQSLNKHILRLRLGEHINLTTLNYQETNTLNGVKISFHPAGHIWGSSQIRIEYKGQVWVVSGDYKIENDGFSGEFEPVQCHTFITESTFALPVFNWQPQSQVIDEINQWWISNKKNGHASIICAYALGKAQRLIANLNHDIGKIYVHGSIKNVNDALLADGAILPEVHYADPNLSPEAYQGALIIAPSSALGTTWVRRFKPFQVATVSGWMQIRGIKKRRGQGKGFILSDHADWKGLNQAIESTEAQQVIAVHGYTDTLARWLQEKGIDAKTKESFLIQNHRK